MKKVLITIQAEVDDVVEIDDIDESHYNIRIESTVDCVFDVYDPRILASKDVSDHEPATLNWQPSSVFWGVAGD